jgi:hypothetical protein
LDGIDLQRPVLGQANFAGVKAMAIREPLFKATKSSRYNFSVLFGREIVAQIRLHPC